MCNNFSIENAAASALKGIMLIKLALVLQKEKKPSNLLMDFHTLQSVS